MKNFLLCLVAAMAVTGIAAADAVRVTKGVVTLADVSGIPEPITFVLLGSALAFVGIAGRRLRGKRN